MGDLTFITGLIQSHPIIALAVAAYFLLARGGSTSGGFGLATFLVPILKYLLSILEPSPAPGPGPIPGPGPAPFDFAAFLKKLLDELFKAKAAGDKDHEEAVLKVMQRCEHCDGQ